MKLKWILLFFVLSVDIYSAEEVKFTYDNNWYIVYTDNDSNVSWPLTAGTNNEKIPKTDCMVGSIKHKYFAPDDDNFTREVICFEGKKEVEQEEFNCKFDTKFKNEDGELDETRTICRKQYKGYRLILEINRYPRGKYWELEQRRRNKNDTRVY